MEDDFPSFVLDQLSGMDDLGCRPMFGGHGLYCGDAFFGILWRGSLYFKVNAKTTRRYESLGMKPFSPHGSKKTLKSFYEVPADVLEDGAQCLSWARRAVEVARENSAKKKKR